MFSTIIMVAIFVSLVMLQVILWAVFLRLGLRWAGVADATTRRIIVATGSVVVIQVMLYVPFRVFMPTSETQANVTSVLELGAGVLVPCLVIMRIFKVGFFRSWQVWLPTLVPSGATVLWAFLVLRPFVCETFVSPTNAMAPTLLGDHLRGRCPECGQASFCSPVDDWYAPPEPLRMICGSFHVNRIPDVSRRAFLPDRFLVAKFLSPRRWDVVVFQYPGNPSTLFVMRVVGLPGETIHIEGGAIWVNGNELVPPDVLRGITYVSEITAWPRHLWGVKHHPAVLGRDEYFVLGDFSPQANDSRLWEQGASGHNPFAVPKSHIRGVVTHIYWPPHRWRVLR